MKVGALSVTVKQHKELGRQPIDGGLLLMASMLLTAFAVGLREANAVCGFRQYLRRDTKLCRISVQQQLGDRRESLVTNLDTSSM